MNTLSNSQLYKIGSFDKAGRYYLKSAFETDTSKAIRLPTRNWPLSIWRHCKTGKFYKSLSKKQLALISS